MNSALHLFSPVMEVSLRGLVNDFSSISLRQIIHCDVLSLCSILTFGIRGFRAGTGWSGSPSRNPDILQRQKVVKIQRTSSSFRPQSVEMELSVNCNIRLTYEPYEATLTVQYSEFNSISYCKKLKKVPLCTVI